MAARAVPLFNATHHPAAPVVIIGLAAMGILSPFWLVGGLAWFSHITVDLAFGQDSEPPTDGVEIGGRCVDPDAHGVVIVDGPVGLSAAPILGRSPVRALR